jgi:hypothetical protein
VGEREKEGLSTTWEGLRQGCTKLHNQEHYDNFLRQILLGLSNQEGRSGLRLWEASGRSAVYTEYD